MATNPSRDALQRMKRRTGMPDASALNDGLFLRAGADGSLEFASAGTGPQGPQGPQGPTGPQGPQGPSGTTTVSDGAITTAKLASGAVTQDKIGSYSISSIKIDTGAVTADKIATGNVTTAKLEPSLEAKFLYNEGAQEPLKPWTGQTISGAYFGFPRKPLNTFYNCRFLGRSSELHCTLNGSTLSENSKNAMFNQVWSAVTMANAGDPDAVLNINFTTNGLTSSNGFTYAQGWVLVSFYSAWTPTAMTARTKDRNGNWTTRTVRKEHSSSPQNQTYINSWSVQLGGNYVTDIELTMTPQSSDTGNRVGVSNISYFGTRMSLSQGPLVTCLGGEYYGDLSGVNQGTTNWTITPSGSADFEDSIKHQGRNVLPQNQFFDATNGYVYTVYGANGNWKATRAGSAGMAQTAVQTSNLPTTLAAVQALTYS